MKLSGDPIRGTVIEGGVECPMFRADNGDRFPLRGIARGRFPVGTRLILVGYFVRVSKCMQGPRTLQIERVLDVELPK